MPIGQLPQLTVKKRTRVTQHNSHHSRIKQPRCIAMNGTHHASCISPPLIDPIPPYITLPPLAMRGFSFLAGGTTSESFLVASLSPLFCFTLSAVAGSTKVYYC